MHQPLCLILILILVHPGLWFDWVISLRIHHWLSEIPSTPNSRRLLSVAPCLLAVAPKNEKHYLQLHPPTSLYGRDPLMRLKIIVIILYTTLQKFHMLRSPITSFNGVILLFKQSHIHEINY